MNDSSSLGEVQEGEVLILEDKEVLDEEGGDSLVSIKQKETTVTEGRLREKEKSKLKYNPYEAELDMLSALPPPSTSNANANYRSTGLDTVSTLRIAAGRKRPKRIQLDFTDEPVAKVATKESDRPVTAPPLLDDDDLRLSLDRSRKAVTQIKFAEISYMPSVEAEVKTQVAGISYEDTLDFAITQEEPAKEETSEQTTSPPINEAMEHMSSSEMAVEPVFEKEPLVRRGVSATLQYLSKRGIRPQLMTEAEAPRNTNSQKFTHITLDHYDEEGNLLTPKEAYKQLSHKFHGKAPGKAKKAKLQKRKTQLAKMSGTELGDTPLGLASALRESQKTSGSSHIALDSKPDHPSKAPPPVSIKIHQPKPTPRMLAPRNVAATTTSTTTATKPSTSQKPTTKIFGLKL